MKARAKKAQTRAKTRAKTPAKALAKGSFYNLTTDPNEPADGVLEMDGEIVSEEGWFGPDGLVIARDIRAALKGLKNVTVKINSPGGDVMAGADIYSALREHSLNGKGRVVVEITALAASAASIIAMAGDEIRMYPTSYMMIHNPWTLAMGDAKELKKAAKTLDVIAEGLINAYQQKTGKSRAKLKAMLDAETWMSAATCVAEGFADEMIAPFGDKIITTEGAKVQMSAKAHGAGEIAARVRGGKYRFGGKLYAEDEEEERDPDEMEDEDEEERDPDETEDEYDPEEEEYPEDEEEDPDEDDPDTLDEDEEEEDPDEARDEDDDDQPEPDEEDPDEAFDEDEEEDPEETLDEDEEEEPDEDDPDALDEDEEEDPEEALDEDEEEDPDEDDPDALDEDEDEDPEEDEKEARRRNNIRKRALIMKKAVHAMTTY